jgi:hypothetical protein
VKGWPGGRDWISSGTLAVRYHLPEALFDGKEPAGFEPIATDRNFALPADPDARRKLIATIQEFDKKRRAERKQDGFKIVFDSQKAAGVDGTDARQLVDALVAKLYVVPPRPATVQQLVEALQDIPAVERAKLACRLILMTPEYQLA